MKNSTMRTVLALALPLILTSPAAAHEVPDPSITHNARDGVVRLYGAGGPDTAFKKVADVFTRETGIKVEVVGGPGTDLVQEGPGERRHPLGHRGGRHHRAA
ncbi:hypothetical protein [Bradyrhizobium genosp. P]|uniref:hypothetical protein n=1 Tax=Bradyrhizobium genosp. P TaxID=83641 RepID=UPI003CEA2274